jgi:hypothetical protein
MPDSDETPQRFRWLNDKLSQSLRRLEQALETTASVRVDDWKDDWRRYRSCVIDRLDLIESALHRLLPAEETLRFKLVGVREDDPPTRSIEAA